MSTDKQLHFIKQLRKRIFDGNIHISTEDREKYSKRYQMTVEQASDYAQSLINTIKANKPARYKKRKKNTGTPPEIIDGKYYSKRRVERQLSIDDARSSESKSKLIKRTHIE